MPCSSKLKGSSPFSVALGVDLEALFEWTMRLLLSLVAGQKAASQARLLAGNGSVSPILA